MRVAVPINLSVRVEDIDALVRAGVTEFYFGYMPLSWVRQYGWEVCSNRRPYPGLPHLTSMEQVRKYVKRIHSLGGKISVAFNEHAYPMEISQKLLRMARAFQRIGVDAFLVADPAFLLLLKKRVPEAVIHASVGLGVKNSLAVDFWHAQGVSRFVIPRKMHPSEMMVLLAGAPSKVEFEIFLMGEWCVFNDEVCFYPHGYGKDDFCVFYHKALSRERGEHYKMRNHGCGLCVTALFKKYEEKIVYKVPLRMKSDGFKGEILGAFSVLNNKLGSALSLKEAMRCRGEMCAYEI